jgi:hypothetical protein
MADIRLLHLITGFPGQQAIQVLSVDDETFEILTCSKVLTFRDDEFYL